MGLLDMVYVCRHCKKGVKVGIHLTCPECGAQVISGAGKGVTPSQWKTMSEEDRAAFVKKILIEEIENPTPAPAAGAVNNDFEKCITTTDGFAGEEVESYLGTVSGTDIYLVGGLMGGGLSNQENLFGMAFASAKKKMFGKALDLGGDAVVGMSVNVTSPGNLNNIIVIVTGTAVKLK